jgi:hypothetical protein
MLAGTTGVWLFYVQHQFEDVYWESGEPQRLWFSIVSAMRPGRRLIATYRGVQPEQRGRWRHAISRERLNLELLVSCADSVEVSGMRLWSDRVVGPSRRRAIERELAPNDPVSVIATG